LYGETWSLILKGKYRGFTGTAAIKNFDPKKEKLTGGRRKLYNKELHAL
jgi:hypothetical protein